MTLEDLGWNAGFAEAWAAYQDTCWQAARLIRDNKITYGVLLGDGRELEVVLGGKVYHDAETDADLPAVGDWVAVEVGTENSEHVIRARLARKTCLSRKMSGRSTEEQVIAANVDVVVVVTDPGPDFNPRRLERYFAIIGRSQAKAVVLVNKADLFSLETSQAAASAIRQLNPEADVYLTSAEDPQSLDVLKAYLRRGISLTFVGSSGVGKSSLVNLLLGDEYQWTDEVNATTGKGRHTTTARELMVLRSGGILIDNPGIREVHMWTDEETLRERFADLEVLAGQCRFSDCRHGATQAGCAIQSAIADGKITSQRLDGFLKLDQELALLQKNREKRQMTVARRARRDHQSKSRRFFERLTPDLESEE
jgi:ribosome biogenesis GTPase